MMRRMLWSILFSLIAFPPWSMAAFRYFDPRDSSAIPRTLSSTGFFIDMARKTPIPDADFFEINAALWSDGAWKQRWLLLPPRKTIPYIDTADLFAYPDSTVFVKNFWLETREGDSTSRILWETRLLMKMSVADEENTWYGFSYRWNRAQNEAFLVSPTAEFDTMFRYTDAGGRRSYKRWRFPSTTCFECHRKGSRPDAAGRRIAGRAVLGFYPAQLKRPSATIAGSNQVVDFFKRGVFSGAAPDSASLARRFVGIHEAIPAVLTPEDRRALLDNKARSYLAANCSGCHGYRGIAVGAIGDMKVNFDFYRLAPAIPFAHFPTQTFSLNDTTRFLPTQDPYGRGAFIDAVVLAGLDTGNGKPWNMSLPPYSGDPKASLTPALLYPGYPSLTELLYRQVRRASDRLDSALLFRMHSISAAGGDSAASGRLEWLFKEPWGSSDWEDTLANHGWTLDSVFLAMGQFADGTYIWRRAPEQMPELGSYHPDTAALNVLAEWVRQYVPTAGMQARMSQDSRGPRVLGRTLAVPREWHGPASVSDLNGRKQTLVRMGPGLYRLPGAMRPGVHVFRIGSRTFRIAVP